MNVDLDKVAAAIRDVATTDILPRWRHLSASDIYEKTGPEDLVTIADQAAEKALSEKLLALYSDTVVVGEEGVAAKPDIMNLFEDNKPVWVIDPIDGTMGFAKGRTEFDMMLALVYGKKLLAGWIYAPVDDDLIMASITMGAVRITRGGAPQRLTPPPVTSLKQLSGILGNKLFSREHRDAIQSQESLFSKLSPSVCAGHDYAALLRGDAHFAVYGKCMPWDHLPGLAMLSMLGFAYCKHDGSAYVPGDTTGGLIIAPNQPMLDEIREMVMDTL